MSTNIDYNMRLCVDYIRWFNPVFHKANLFAQTDKEAT
jgi:beta-lactamase regulating signal transducer with metallopeptidase domain